LQFEKWALREVIAYLVVIHKVIEVNIQSVKLAFFHDGELVDINEPILASLGTCTIGISNDQEHAKRNVRLQIQILKSRIISSTNCIGRMLAKSSAE
jgi:hypothetical protein